MQLVPISVAAKELGFSVRQLRARIRGAPGVTLGGRGRGNVTQIDLARLREHLGLPQACATSRALSQAVFEEAIAVHRRMSAELLRTSEFQRAFGLNRYGAEQLLGYLGALYESALHERVEGSEN
jgi:hypothetical protein